MLTNDEDTNLTQLHDIWYRQFGAVVSVSGVDQNLVAEAMMTIAIAAMLRSDDRTTVAARLAALAGGLHRADQCQDGPPAAMH